jgi:hypothetical protein
MRLCRFCPAAHGVEMTRLRGARTGRTSARGPSLVAASGGLGILMPPACIPCAQRDQHTLRAKSTPGQQGEHWHTDPLLGTQAPAKIEPRLSETRGQISDPPRRERDPNTLRGEERTQQRLVPLASLRSARVLGGFRPSF